MSRDAAVQIIQTLREAGHVAYLAGGCVRDRLLGLSPKDHDVATDAPPDVVQKLFRRSQPVGEAFGVVLVYPDQRNRRAKNAGGLEVATFRTEGVYSDGRHPDQVEFSDAKHDAQRRDFTINGLFEDPLHDAHPNPEADADGVIDYVGGRADLEAKTLRAIGDPDRRFGEDYLRMLRAVRFTTRLGFALDPATAQAVRNLAKFLGQISRERIGGELQLMLTSPHFTAAADLLQQLRLDGPTLNEDHLDAALPTLRKLSPDARYAAKLAAWMIDRHQFPLSASPAELVTRWRQALCLSNYDSQTVRSILRQSLAALVWVDMPIAQRKRWLASPVTEDAIYLLRAMEKSDPIETDASILANDGIGISPPPIIDGSDLISFGITPGPVFKNLLDSAYDQQLEGKLKSKAQFKSQLDRPADH
ncbi:MAG: CCA tRNA nucleotidyltransferase [Planctomycetota bacterium]